MQHKSVHSKQTTRKRPTVTVKPGKPKESRIEVQKKTQQPAQEQTPATIKAPDGTVYVIPPLPDDAAEVTMLASAETLREVFGLLDME